MSTPAPQIPQNVIVQQANGQVLITWNQIAGITNYVVQRSTDNITYTTISSPVIPQYLDTAVTTGTQYWYQVASNNGVQSNYSSAVSVTPVETGEMTLGQLRLLAQQKADRVNSNFVTTAEWNTYINQSYFELYDLLVQKFGNEYYVAPPLLFQTTGAQFYDLPTGINYSGAPSFYKLLGVDLGLNGADNAWITLKKFMFIERNRYIYPQITTNLLGVAGMRYRTMGSQIEFIPTPSAGQTVRLWYIPRMTMLLQDTDQADGISGWTEYVAVDAAIKALQKEESDVTVLAAQKQALMQRIESAAENRDAGEPETISDTARWADRWGFGPNGDGTFGGW